MTQYADETFLRNAGHDSLLEGLTSASIDVSLVAASQTADSYLGARYTLPLLAWGDDLRRAVCDIAAYDIATKKGFGLDGVVSLLRVRYEDVIKWLTKVAAGTVVPTGITDSATPSSSTRSRASVGSNTPRGW